MRGEKPTNKVRREEKN